MTKLMVRYTADELARMRALFFPEERRYEFTRLPWDGVSFRHYRDPKIACIEYYRPVREMPGPPSKLKMGS
jgi:hypothetical protein